MERSWEAEVRKENSLKAKLYRAKMKAEGKKVWRSPESIEKRKIASKRYWGEMPKEEKSANRKAVNKRWYAKNWNKYYQDNRCKEISKVQNRKVQKLGNGGTHTAGDVKILWNLQNGKCTWCLQQLDEKSFQVDHKIPIKLGGRNDKGNLQLLHEYCNKSKAAKHPIEHGLKSGLLAW